MYVRRTIQGNGVYEIGGGREKEKSSHGATEKVNFFFELLNPMCKLIYCLSLLWDLNGGSCVGEGSRQSHPYRRNRP